LSWKANNKINPSSWAHTNRTLGSKRPVDVPQN